jgi:hypothetical protein
MGLLVMYYPSDTLYVTQQEIFNLLARCFSADELEDLSKNATFRSLMERSNSTDDFERLTMAGHRILSEEGTRTSHLEH